MLRGRALLCQRLQPRKASPAREARKVEFIWCKWHAKKLYQSRSVVRQGCTHTVRVHFPVQPWSVNPGHSFARSSRRAVRFADDVRKAAVWPTPQSSSGWTSRYKANTSVDVASAIVAVRRHMYLVGALAVARTLVILALVKDAMRLGDVRRSRPRKRRRCGLRSPRDSHHGQHGAQIFRSRCRSRESNAPMFVKLHLNSPSTA